VRQEPRCCVTGRRASPAVPDVHGNEESDHDARGSGALAGTAVPGSLPARRCPRWPGTRSRTGPLTPGSPCGTIARSGRAQRRPSCREAPQPDRLQGLGDTEPSVRWEQTEHLCRGDPGTLTGSPLVSQLQWSPAGAGNERRNTPTYVGTKTSKREATPGHRRHQRVPQTQPVSPSSSTPTRNGGVSNGLLAPAPPGQM